MKIQRTSLLALAVAAALGITGCASWTTTKTAASPVSASNRGPVETTADAAITAKVNAAFAADQVVKARNINVDTVRGVVSLNGTVKSATERSRAMELARNVSGVTEVRDGLKVEG
jgi:hyperosmotically inducible protein